MEYTIGVDLGGTKLNIGLVKDGKILKKVKVPTPTKESKDYIIGAIVDGINEVMKDVSKKDVKGVGLGIPGILNEKRETIVTLTNLRSLENVPLKKVLEDKLGLPIVMDNDVNVFALGELNYGACKGKKNAACLAIGTGLGGAVIIDGELYRGRSSAGEFGHINIVPNGNKCGCGANGCLEAHVAKNGFAIESKKVFGEARDPLEVEKAARAGDAKSKKLYSNLGSYLGAGLANVVNVLDPEIIVVGGGLGNALDLMLDSTKEMMGKRMFLDMPPIVKAKLGTDAGLIGASCLISHNY